VKRKTIYWVAAVALWAGCGGSSGGHHADAAVDGPAAEHPADTAADATTSDGAADADAQTTTGDGATDLATADGAGAADSSTTDGAGGADGGANDASSDVPADAPGDASADGDAPRSVTYKFTGKVTTLTSSPLGLDKQANGALVSGSFTYDLGLVDDLPSDPERGKYQRGGATAFTLTVSSAGGARTVTGSGKAIVVIENLSPDTLRFLDGPQSDGVVRTMKIDGVDAPALKVALAITDTSVGGGFLASDALPTFVPYIDIANKDTFNVSHTFSVEDSGGALLLRLDSIK
jgi:hypothetical protein